VPFFFLYANNGYSLKTSQIPFNISDYLKRLGLLEKENDMLKEQINKLEMENKKALKEIIRIL
jgi:cell division protein FtsB